MEADGPRVQEYTLVCFNTVDQLSGLLVHRYTRHLLFVAMILGIRYSQSEI